MTAFYIILAASPVLLLGTVAFFVIIVVGIRRGDRGDLTTPPKTRIDAISRRVSGVGVRNPSGTSEGQS
jgi:hypothetical protein